MGYSHITIIYNPNSTGPSQRMAEELTQALARYPAPVELQASQRAGHAEELARAAAARGEHPLVVSASGDGGYHEVVNGVMAANTSDRQAAAAVLPGGNGNDHRRAIARGTLAEGILGGRTARIDLLQVTVTPPDAQPWSRYAHSYTGLGLTPMIATELNHHDLNLAIEARIVIKTLAQFQPVTIRHENEDLALDSLILANVKETGKVLSLTDTCGPADGRFEISLFPASSKLQLLGRLLRAVIFGLQPIDRRSSYQFETTAPTAIQIDGEVSELAAGSRVVVTSRRHALETVL